MYAVIKRKKILGVYGTPPATLEKKAQLVPARDNIPSYDERYQQLIPPASFYNAPDAYRLCGDIVYRDWAVRDSLAAVITHAKKLLGETDWSQGKDIKDSTSEKWQSYREALRDIINNTTNPSAVIWPEQPTQ